jgi:transcriptional regulator of arginine metabolism
MYNYAPKLNIITMNKEERLRKIRELISSKIISSQEELQEELRGHGFLVTQATLSRDLKNLRVVKITQNSGDTRYAIQDGTIGMPVPVLPDTLEGVLSIEFSGQLGVLKTLPGFANAVAYYIDRLRLPEVMGTIAGDDTILIIAREGISNSRLAGIFSRYFKGLHQKIF